MNEKKICFISCVNDHQLYKESLYYINQLEIPEGYEIECICVEDAISMTQGYNKAMKESDAKYKVYLHQDVYIINKSFIRDVLDVFNSDNKVGMLGMAGAKTIPTNGVWEESTHKYGEVYESHTGKMELLQLNKVESNYEEVKVIDGFIIITQYDIPWREDIFDGWYFYDVSQSIEFASKGYKVVIPEQEEVWCIHDCGIANDGNGFDYYRNIFLDEYSNDSSRACYIEIEKDYSRLKSIRDEVQGPYQANKGNSILITNNHLVNYAGSEIVTLNLAKNFKMMGFKVFVGTFTYGYPIKELFERNDINVNSLLDNSLNNMKFDFIWGQHFTTIYSALFSKKISANKIIVNSMSPFEPLESPPIFSNYLSLNVVNSEETKEKIVSEGVDKSNIYIMPNPVEYDFALKYKKRKKNLNKVCVVSNHVPKEIYEAMNILREKGIEIDIFGINDNVVYITPELLDSYDALITIGKTVQYGLVMGIPVYCYDRFGGPGWIRTFNFYRAYNYNFSGRCTNKRISSLDIVYDVINGYEGAFGEKEIFHEFALKNFIMKDHLQNILEIVNEKEIVDIKLIKQLYGMVERHNLLYLSNLK